jgi:hypothetical protein
VPSQELKKMDFSEKWICSAAAQRLAFAEHGAGVDGGELSERKKAEA